MQQTHQLGARDNGEPVKGTRQAAGLVVPPGGVGMVVGVRRNDSPDLGQRVIVVQQPVYGVADHGMVDATAQLLEDAQADAGGQGRRAGRAQVGLEPMTKAAVAVLKTGQLGEDTIGRGALEAVFKEGALQRPGLRFQKLAGAVKGLR